MQGTFTRELAVITDALRDQLDEVERDLSRAEDVEILEGVLDRAERLAQLPEEEIARLVGIVAQAFPQASTIEDALAQRALDDGDSDSSE